MNQPRAPLVNPKTVPRPVEIRVAGHFGEFAQGRLGPDGPVAAVSAPCPALTTAVGFTPARGALRCDSEPGAIALGAAALTLTRIGAEGWGGALRTQRPVPPGWGAGSSTAEALGAIRAVAAAFGLRLPPAEEARLCVESEGATDPAMIPRPCVFATREGRILRPLPPLPPMRIVGGFCGGAQRTDPDDHAFPDMASTLDAMERALRMRDFQGFAAAATASARANQARNPNPAFDAIMALARRCGAGGVLVAHTGAAIGLILPPDADDAAALSAVAALGLTRPLAFDPALATS